MSSIRNWRHTLHVLGASLDGEAIRSVRRGFWAAVICGPILFVAGVTNGPPYGIGDWYLMTLGTVFVVVLIPVMCALQHGYRNAEIYRDNSVGSLDFSGAWKGTALGLALVPAAKLLFDWLSPMFAAA